MGNVRYLQHVDTARQGEMMASLQEMTPQLAGPMQWTVADRAPDQRSHKSVRAGGDLERIFHLPRRPATDLNGSARAAGMIELMTERLARQRKSPCECRNLGRECIHTLKAAQAWALYEGPLSGGLLGYIGVGHGKTGLDILMPMVMPGCQLAVLLVPPGLRAQLMRDYLAWREHFRVPSIRIGDLGGHIVPGAPALHVIPYTIFSRPESTDLLERLNPDLIIADEVHKLRHKDTARTGRLLRYFAAHPNTRFCGWSGSILAKSIKDKAHLAALALRGGSPYPLNPATVDEWACAIDPSDHPAPPGALKIFIQGGETLASAVQRRTNETRGIVATQGSAIGASIYIRERAITVPPSICTLLKALRNTWERPDGELLLDAFAFQRCAEQLASGFYYRWVFPRKEDPKLIKEWKTRRRNWHSEVREVLKRRVPHMDSEGLCEHAAIRFYSSVPYQGNLPTWRSDEWPAWIEIRDEVKHDTETVWVDTFLAKDAAEWATKNRGIVWCGHSALRHKIAELGKLASHGGGPGAESRILAETGNRSIVVSIKSHGTGRDGLQRIFDNQLIANPPPGGDASEQLLGRLHREGFAGDEIGTEMYRHTQEVANAIASAVAQAKWVFNMTRAEQKLLMATWDFDPSEKDLDLP